MSARWPTGPPDLVRSRYRRRSGRTTAVAKRRSGPGRARTSWERSHDVRARVPPWGCRALSESGSISDFPIENTCSYHGNRKRRTDSRVICKLPRSNVFGDRCGCGGQPAVSPPQHKWGRTTTVPASQKDVPPDPPRLAATFGSSGPPRFSRPIPATIARPRAPTPPMGRSPMRNWKGPSTCHHVLSRSCNNCPPSPTISSRRGPREMPTRPASIRIT